MNYINIYVNYLKEKFLVQQVLQIQFLEKIQYNSSKNNNLLFWFRTFKIFKLQDILEFDIVKLNYVHFKDQLPSNIKDIFSENETDNP